MLKSIEWTRTICGKTQCIYESEEGGQLLIRRYGDYDWMAINLSIKHWGVGQIMAKGQSDIDCLTKVEKILEQ